MKRSAAIGMAVVLCVSLVPASALGAAFAADAFQQRASSAAVDPEIATAYAIADLPLAGIQDAAALEAALVKNGYTENEVLNLSIKKLEVVDGSLAATIARLQNILTSTKGEEAAPTNPPAAGIEGGTGTDSVDPSNPVAPGNPEGPSNPDNTEGIPGESDGSTDEGEGDAVTGDDAADATNPATPTTDPDATNDAGQAPETADLDAMEHHPLSPLNPINGQTEYPAWSYSGSKEYTRHPLNLSLTTSKFIAVIGEQARQLAAKNDLYASVMIAQAILESNSGNSALSQNPNFNLFGIKGSYNGESVTKYTAEDDGTGTKAIIKADFRKYPGYQESLEDYVNLLTKEKGGFYAGAHKRYANSYADACEYLQGRYATDTAYASKLLDIIESYDLARYDEPLDYELAVTYMVPVESKDVVGKTAGVATSETAATVAASETSETVMEERGLADLAAEVTSHLGEDYVWGGNSCGGFDCSGLVSYAYKHALDVTIPRTTRYQCLQGEDVDFADLHTGDLVFFADSDGVCCHVGMYLGEGCYIEAPQPGDVVKITSLEEKEPTFAKRLLKTQPVALDEELSVILEDESI